MKTIQMKQPHANDYDASAMGETEGARRATGVPPMAGGRDSFVSSPPDPEVPEKKPRRKFTAIKGSSLRLTRSTKNGDAGN